MAWLAVNKNGEEMLFTDKKPERWRNEWVMTEEDKGNSYVLKKGTIIKHVGKSITWKDEPYELTD